MKRSATRACLSDLVSRTTNHRAAIDTPRAQVRQWRVCKHLPHAPTRKCYLGSKKAAKSTNCLHRPGEGRKGREGGKKR